MIRWQIRTKDVKACSIVFEIQFYGLSIHTVCSTFTQRRWSGYETFSTTSDLHWSYKEPKYAFSCTWLLFVVLSLPPQDTIFHVRLKQWSSALISSATQGTACINAQPSATDSVGMLWLQTYCEITRAPSDVSCAWKVQLHDEDSVAKFSL